MAWAFAHPTQACEARERRMRPSRPRAGLGLPAEHRPQQQPPFSGQQTLRGQEVPRAPSPGSPPEEVQSA